jgi:hypothetical protein
MRHHCPTEQYDASFAVVQSLRLHHHARQQPSNKLRKLTHIWRSNNRHVGGMRRPATGQYPVTPARSGAFQAAPFVVSYLAGLKAKVIKRRVTTTLLYLSVAACTPANENAQYPLVFSTPRCFLTRICAVVRCRLCCPLSLRVCEPAFRCETQHSTPACRGDLPQRAASVHAPRRQRSVCIAAGLFAGLPALSSISHTGRYVFY